MFLDGAFYVDRLTSRNGVDWQPVQDVLIPRYAVGGYLLTDTTDDGHNPAPLTAWKPGATPRPITVDATPASADLTNDAAPETLTTPLPGGETCTTHRCVVLGATLYLLR
ncbi:MAG: hypothetical protein KIT84_08670 [Labilithrix sp.]|nr:hypothetical protein [Labilithrix sp.]MCW5811072.1 hypothetical protein [Labilithrix sp.]